MIRQSRQPMAIIASLNLLMCGPFPGAGIAIGEEVVAAKNPAPSVILALALASAEYEPT
jgi:hypothetical protein